MQAIMGYEAPKTKGVDGRLSLDKDQQQVGGKLLLPNIGRSPNNDEQNEIRQNMVKD